MINFDNSILINFINNKISIYELCFGPIRIGVNIDVVDIMEINDIYINNPLNGSYNFEDSNFTITERFEKLKLAEGWIHFAGGLSCGVKNQEICDFRISKRYIEQVNRYTREEIISFYGQPDYELEDVVWSLENYILVYNNKKVNFYISPEINTLSSIYTGALDISKFTLR